MFLKVMAIPYTIGKIPGRVSRLTVTTPAAMASGGGRGGGRAVAGKRASGGAQRLVVQARVVLHGLGQEREHLPRRGGGERHVQALEQSRRHLPPRRGL